MLGKTEDFQFEMIGTDRAGRRVPFKMPLLFVGVEANEHEDSGIMEEIIEQYNAEPAEPRRTAHPNGIPFVTFRSTGFRKAIRGCRLSRWSSMLRRSILRLYRMTKRSSIPQVEHADTGIAAIQRLLQKPNTVEVKYAEAYNNHGFGPGNEGELSSAR